MNKKIYIFLISFLCFIGIGCFLYFSNENKKNELEIDKISNSVDSIVEVKTLRTAKVEHFMSHFYIELNVRPFHPSYREWDGLSSFSSRKYAIYMYKNQNDLLKRYSIDSLHVILSGKSTVNLFTTKTQASFCYRIDDSHILVLSKMYDREPALFTEPSKSEIFILNGEC